MEVSLYSQKSIDAMSELERLRISNQLLEIDNKILQRIIKAQDADIATYNRQLDVMADNIEQLIKEVNHLKQQLTSG